jgi:acyl carrier protein
MAILQLSGSCDFREGERAMDSETNAGALIERIREIVAGQLGVEADEVVAEASILDDLGADSLDVVELVMALEEEFDIEVPDEDVEGMRTVADVESYVSTRVLA